MKRISILLIVCSFVTFNASAKGKAKGRKNKEPAIKLSEKITVPENTAEVLQALSDIQQKGKSTTDAENILKKLEINNLYYDMAQLYLGDRAVSQGHYDEALQFYSQAEKHAKNKKIQNRAQLGEAQARVETKKYRDARASLVKLEKRFRSSEDHPQLVWRLMQAEKGLGNHRELCKWAAVMYSRYPTFPGVSDWGGDLGSNKFENRTLGCSASLDVFKTRMKALLWAGLINQAQREVDDKEKDLKKVDALMGDMLRAQFLVHSGEPIKALELMTPYLDSQKHNISYLNQLAAMAARSGDFALAVSAYDQAYKQAGKNKNAREFLFSAAFMSYQAQDYEGAEKRFTEYKKLFRKSKVAMDADWHLAWLQYLKGNYDKCVQQLDRIVVTYGKRKAPMDRIQYWKSMAYIKMGEVEKARPILSKLAGDPLLSYYALAAQKRLQKLGAKPENTNNGSNNVAGMSLIKRWLAFSRPMPSLDAEGVRTESNNEEDTTIVGSSEDQPLPTDDGNDAEIQETAEASTENTEVITEVASFGKENLDLLLTRAQDMAKAGFIDLAQADLAEIQRKAGKKEHLRKLMVQYSNTQDFYRSSEIAHQSFIQQRAAQGINGARNLWELAYPQAFVNYVDTAVNQDAIPREFVWGIMRAESHYRHFVVSPAGAIGLMQIMPYTGTRLAQIASVKGFDARQLFDPAISVQLGTKYLHRLLGQMNQNIPLAAAAYNAGPHRVQLWVKTFGHLDSDEFIEHIPFLETRNYVKRVISNTHIYSQLYGNKVDYFSFLAEALPKPEVLRVAYREEWDTAQ